MVRPSAQVIHDRIQEVRYEESLYWKDLLKKRDEWIVELIKEGEAARTILRQAVIEPGSSWAADAKTLLNEQRRRDGFEPEFPALPVVQGGE